MTLHLASARLKPGGTAFLYGANDEGIKPAADRAGELYGDVKTLDTRRHCRVLGLKQPQGEPKGRLEDWIEDASAKLPDGELTWKTFPGLFAHGRLDAGTAYLLEGLPPVAEGATVLDFASGAGVVALAARRRRPDLSFDLLDVDALALHAASLNVPGSRLLLQDGAAGLQTGRYDLIISNPPFHVGVGPDLTVLHQLLEEAPRALKPDGVLRVVVQSTLDIRKRLEARFTEVRVAVDAKAYRVWETRGVRKVPLEVGKPQGSSASSRGSRTRRA